MSWERMRKVKDLETFFEQCTESERVVVHTLMQLIQECAEFQIKISYGVPYFYRKRRVLFLWPASAAFGPKQGVLLGFCQGSMMLDTFGLLERGSRKQLACITLLGLDELPTAELRDYIVQAIMIDDQF